MNLFARISTTLSATAGHTVARFENHEAIGRAALDRAHEGVARARAVERRHARQGDALTERCTGTRAAIDDWGRRAREAPDDVTALQCLQRRHDERERLAALDETRHRHAADACRLSGRVRELERGLDTMAERYRALASRETLARADHAVERIADTRVDELFERWETRVDVAEMAGGCGPGRERLAGDTGYGDRQDRGDDTFESRFVDEERRRRLVDELRALRAENGEQP